METERIEDIKGQQFLFKKHKILYCKICHESQGGSKLSKFKSKKQTFMDFLFFWFDSLLDPS